MTNTKFKAAIYLRLSRENGTGMESDSIVNQRNIIYDYVNSHPEIQICDEMADDGFSGGNSERPEFQRLLSEISVGNINCIIVKDLSRFSRDYISSGNYLEKVFPLLGVRFISVNDNIDSFENDNSDNMIIPIKNIMNDAYLRDISLKVRSSFDVKRKNGEFVGSSAPFGYVKSPEDRHNLIIDDEAARIVRMIFFMSLCGVSSVGIAEKLNALGILSPYEHKKQLGLAYKTSFTTKEKSLWSPKAVIRILQDDIFIGTLTQGITTTPNHKIRKRIVKPAEKWVVVENAHEPIISNNIFKVVNKLFLIDTRRAPNSDNSNTFSGLVLCKDCRQNMILKMSRQHRYYICSTHRAGNGCFSHTINIATLSEIVLDKLNEHLNNMDDKELFVNKISDEIHALSEDPGDIFVFDGQGKIKKLTRLILVMMVDSIYVTESKGVHIEFNSLD